MRLGGSLPFCTQSRVAPVLKLPRSSTSHPTIYPFIAGGKCNCLCRKEVSVPVVENESMGELGVELSTKAV